MKKILSITVGLLFIFLPQVSLAVSVWATSMGEYSHQADHNSNATGRWVSWNIDGASDVWPSEDYTWGSYCFEQWANHDGSYQGGYQIPSYSNWGWTGAIGS